MTQKLNTETPTPTSPNLPSKHRAWMNTKKFKRNDETFEVTEGARVFVENDVVNVVRFKSLANGKQYEMSEEKFFSRVSELELMSTQVNRNN